MARGRDQANPKSVMTGPAWQPARDKLRGAAHGTRKNAAKCSTTYHAALRADRKAFAELEFSGYQSMPGKIFFTALVLPEPEEPPSGRTPTMGMMPDAGNWISWSSAKQRKPRARRYVNRMGGA